MTLKSFSFKAHGKEGRYKSSAEREITKSLYILPNTYP